jgi:hypothetical protein
MWLLQVPVHCWQAAPPEPQLFLLVPARQTGGETVLSQHPVGQTTPSQIQVPPTQCCPLVPHWAPVAPHVHVPVAEQLSARISSQATQVLPAVPQAACDGGTQMLP